MTERPVVFPVTFRAVRAALEACDYLERPDPWMTGDDYGEGYTDGKSAAARLVRAAIADGRFDPTNYAKP